MKEMQVEVIALAIAGNPKSRLRVTWKTQPNWFTRIALGAKSREVSAIFAGTRDVWHVLPEWRRAPPAFERQLQQAEARLLRAEAPLTASSQGTAAVLGTSRRGQSDIPDLDRAAGTQPVIQPRHSEARPHSSALAYTPRRSYPLKLR